MASPLDFTQYTQKEFTKFSKAYSWISNIMGVLSDTVTLYPHCVFYCSLAVMKLRASTYW